MKTDKIARDKRVTKLTNSITIASLFSTYSGNKFFTEVKNEN